MKNKFLWMATLALVLNLFSACNDDDEKEIWKELPTTPIEIDGSNAMLTVNGETSTTGQVAFKAESESRAMLTLTDVVGGYPSLEIPVEMTPQTDGNSYAFTGSTTVNTAPQVRSVSADPALLTVDVNGTISTDGKVSITLTAYGAGLNLGTYAGATLTLTYSGSNMMGATVYYTVSGTTPVLTLANIVPGEPEVSLEGVYTDGNGAFSGTATTSGGATVNYEGAVNPANGMTLALNVTMPDALGLVGIYGWAEIENAGSYDGQQGMPSGSGFYMDVVDENGSVGGDNSSLGFMVRPLLGGILPQVLDNVTFAADGNIAADYSSASIAIPMADEYDLTDANQQMMWLYAGIMSGGFTQEKLNTMLDGRTYQPSPANLAHWFIKDRQLNVKLNVAAIVSQALADKGMTDTGLDLSSIINQLLNTDAQGLRELLGSFSSLMGDYADFVKLLTEKASDDTLKTLLDWVKNGIPLNIEQTAAGHTRIYLDRDDLCMFILLLKDPELYTAFTAMLPTEAQMAAGFIYQICNDWDNLSTFNIGLDLIKK